MVSVSLSVRCDETRWGEEVAVVGSWNSWDKKDFTKLSTTPRQFPTWQGAIRLPDSIAGKRVEYKYVIVKDSRITRWEGEGRRNNRAVEATKACVNDVFGQFRVSDAIGRHSPPSEAASKKWANKPVSARDNLVSADLSSLDALERAIVAKTVEQRSWRQRLAFVRSLFTEKSVANDARFDSRCVDHLATVSIYLTFLASGQLRCEEDGGHHRPNHHSNEARQIELALASITQSVVESETSGNSTGPASYIPYVVRKIFPQLPSYSSQFTVSVPLTRIRDIAHRSDIPHDFKQEIKHTLQNKLHRCAGPEDLRTSERLLERINRGDFSHGLKEQFRIFHTELCAFFNASSLDDRMHYLEHCENTRDVASLATSFLGLKRSKKPATAQLEALTRLRHGIAKLRCMQASSEGNDELPTEDIQKTRLADIDLEAYAFVLLASIAKVVEQQHSSNTLQWPDALQGLVLAMENVALSGISPREAAATASELSVLSQSGSLHSNEFLRAKAATDRALRFVHSFSVAISDVYSRRVESIGRALGVDDHAISVFAEAEIRSNVAFQASRIADACAKACRRSLSLPPWDPLYAGTASGKLVFARELSDLSEHRGTSIVAVCRYAEGDEDIPANVAGVILGRALPHLSHLGVRARQAGVVFVCAETHEAFEEIWQRREHSMVTVVVNATEGLASFSETVADTTTRDTGAPGLASNGPTKVTAKIDFDDTVKVPIPIAKAAKGTSSSKSAFAGKLMLVATDSDKLFDAPSGVALPHGVFQAVRSKHSKQYASLVQRYETAWKNGKDIDTAAAVLHEFVETKFSLDDKICAAIQKSFAPGARLMVRSSANAEDLEEMSGAGLYDSIANVPAHETQALQRAVSQVWASLWTKRAASSRATYGVAHGDVSMAVLIQEMVQSDLSFVGFSRDPVSKEDVVYVEVAVGMGETLASASADGSPYRFRVRRETLDVETVSFASYGDALVPGEDGLVKRVVDYAREAMTTDDAFRAELVQRIARCVMKLETEFGGPQDIEGAVVVEGGRATVFVVQARPQIL